MVLCSTTVSRQALCILFWTVRQLNELFNSLVRAFERTILCWHSLFDLHHEPLAVWRACSLGDGCRDRRVAFFSRSYNATPERLTLRCAGPAFPRVKLDVVGKGVFVETHVSGCCRRKRDGVFALGRKKRHVGNNDCGRGP